MKNSLAIPFSGGWAHGNPLPRIGSFHILGKFRFLPMNIHIQLGDKVQDVVTGLEGIVTARIEYLTGCKQCGITPAAKDGKLLDTQYIDHSRLKVVGDRCVLPPAPDGGGSMSDAPGGSHGRH